MSDTEGPENYGRMLRQHRLDRGLTQPQLAGRSRISVRTIRDIERGGCRRPRRETIRLMADGLGLAGRDRAEFEAAGRTGTDGEALFAAEPIAPPAPVDALVGREAEVAALTGSLAAAGQRLVTVTGVGGVGKTRLALEVASRLHRAERFPVLWTSAADGPFPAAGGADPLSRVLRTGLSALVRTPAGGGAVAGGAGLAAVVGGRPALLVLDGYEADRIDAARLTGLLRACSGLRVLATSGPPLGLPAERVFPLAPLAVPAGWDPDPDTGSPAAPAVRLLTRHVRQVRPDFRTDPADVRVLAALAWRVDGIPAALEAVASWIVLYEPHDLLAHLDAEPFEFLRPAPAGPGTPDLGDRLGRLLDALDAEEHALLTALADRAEPWSVAEVVAASGRPTGDGGRLVARLLARGVIAPSGPGRSRFRVLGLVRRLLHGRAATRSGAPEHATAGPR